MPHKRRYIESLMPYEIVFRARESMPFPCTRYMNSIIKSVLSRVQRDNKIILHHYIFEITHVHIICTARDIESFQQFYSQLEKQLTDSIKALMGLEYLSIWKERPNVSIIPTYEDMIRKISYVLANPSNDSLVNTISEYTGVNSFITFKNNNSSLNYCYKEENTWIRLPSIPRLKSASISYYEDLKLNNELLKNNKESHELEVYPNSWIKAFIKRPKKRDIKIANKRILTSLEMREEANRKKRIKENKKVAGISKLRKLPLLKPHTPKKKGRRIFVQSMFKDVRCKIIEKVKRIDKKCRELYEEYKYSSTKSSYEWPAGTYPPAFPSPVASIEYAFYGT